MPPDARPILDFLRESNDRFAWMEEDPHPKARGLALLYLLASVGIEATLCHTRVVDARGETVHAPQDNDFNAYAIELQGTLEYGTPPGDEEALVPINWPASPAEARQQAFRRITGNKYEACTVAWERHFSLCNPQMDTRMKFLHANTSTKIRAMMDAGLPLLQAWLLENDTPSVSLPRHQPRL